MKRVVLLTGSEKRHDFFRILVGLTPGVDLVRTYCEAPIESGKLIQGEGNVDFRTQHLLARTQSEEDFFGLFIRHCPDESHPLFIPRGDINDDNSVKSILDLNPDYIISYGCSIIKSELISHFKGRFINLHLGLSPYYRGSGTNFWPLVNREPQFVGATFMHIDEGIDTGMIIHQFRAHMTPFDTVHSIGNRLIRDAAQNLGTLIRYGVGTVQEQKIEFGPVQEKVYKNRDFTENSVRQLYENFKTGMIEEYLEKKSEIDIQYPIFENPSLLLT